MPPTGLLFIALVIYKHGEPRCNDIVRGKPKDSKKSHFVNYKSHIY
jgi:hypothetical protein